MSSLIKRSNGIYYFISTIDGARRWISTGETIREKALRRIPTLTYNQSHRVKIPMLSEFIDQFLEIGCSTHRPGTSDIYRRALYSFLQCIGNKKISLVGVKHIDVFKHQKLHTIQPTTLNMYLRSLKAAFNKAVDWEILQRNPFRKVQQCPVPQRAPQFLTLDQFRSLIQTIKEPWLLQAIHLGVFTGMRRSEIANLQWKHIDFAREMIIVESDANFQTKTGKRRILPMNSLVNQLLHSMYTQRTGNYVIMLGGKPVRTIWISRRFKQYIQKMDIDKSLHFHILRHTFASWLVQAGVPIYEVQALMGHSTIRVTQIYSHLIPKQLRTSVEMIIPPENILPSHEIMENVESLKVLV